MAFSHDITFCAGELVDCPKKELVEFTRQEIANFTGLRVETVIRELSKMSKTNKVEIINHKLYY